VLLSPWRLLTSMKNTKTADTAMFPMVIDGEPIRWTHFITLTSPNGVSHRLHRRQVVAFLRRLSAITRTHLFVRLGGDAGKNVHSHILLGIPLSQHATFMDRLSAFTPWKSWRHKTLEFLPFCPVAGGGLDGRNTQMYLVKDEHQYQREGWVCPNRHRECKNGFCPFRAKLLSLTAY